MDHQPDHIIVACLDFNKMIAPVKRSEIFSGKVFHMAGIPLAIFKIINVISQLFPALITSVRPAFTIAVDLAVATACLAGDQVSGVETKPFTEHRCVLLPMHYNEKKCH